jgi:predicted GIY-YIG superfamily endonuclease
MNFERTQTWTFEEVQALDIAIEKYGQNWELIINEFGLPGKPLEWKATKIKLYQKARARALELYQKDLYSTKSKVYHIIIKPENFLKLVEKGSLSKKKLLKPPTAPVASKLSPPEPKKQKTYWTEEQDLMLISAYNEFKKLQVETGKKFSVYNKIVEKHPELKERHKSMVLRDRVGLLQSRIVKKGEFVEYPARRSWHDYRKWLFNEQSQQFVYCFKEVTSGCGRFISERELMTEGLSCKCGRLYKELAKYTRKYPHITYIITEKGKSLTEEVLYVGYTANLSERLQAHKSNLLKDKEYTVRITTRLSEETALKIFKGVKNYVDNTKTYCTLGSKITNINNDEYVPDNTESYIYHHELSGILMTNTSMVKEYVHRINGKWCYIKDSSKDIQEECKCNIKCPVRSIVNQWRGLEKYYPLKIEEVSKIWSNDKNEIDYTIGIAARTKEFLLECIKRKVSLKESTIKGYYNNIKMLCEKANLIENITDGNKILNTIYKTCKNNSTLEKYLMMIPIVYRTLSDNEKEIVFGINHFSIFTILSNEFIKIKKTRDEERASGQKSQKQIENWIEYNVLVDMFKKYKAPSMEDGVEYDTYFAIKLHLFQVAIRNDYRTVKLFDYDPESDNYIDWDKKCFVFNEYKTAGTYGKISTEIKQEVIKDIEQIRQYRMEKRLIYLLNSENNTPLSTSCYSNRISAQMKKICDKHISPIMLRNIFVSYIRKDEIVAEASKQLAKDMHHSEHTSRTIYRKL